MPVTKFEVGKKYYFIEDPKKVVIDCIFVSPSGRPLMQYPGGKEVLLDPQYDYTKDYRKNYSEYVEPKKGTVWVNIYSDSAPYVHGTKEAAEKGALMGNNKPSPSVIARIEVPWTEGQGL
jgi:hypothetical protein